MSELKIVIFYHIFAIGDYKNIVNYQLHEIKESGVYKSCHSINLGVIFKQKSDLKYIQNLAKENSKINIYHQRKFKDLPIKLFEGSAIDCKIELGEGETIMKMYDYSIKNMHDNDLYMFIHTKGVTKPPDRQRHGKIKTIVPHKNQLNARELRDTVLHTMTKHTVTDWREHVGKLSHDKILYHYAWNFFWMRGDFLRQFDETTYNINCTKKSRRFPPRQGKPNDRHYTAFFPLSLYESLHPSESFDMRLKVGAYY